MKFMLVIKCDIQEYIIALPIHIINFDRIKYGLQ